MDVNPYSNRRLPVGRLDYTSKLGKTKNPRPWDTVEAMLDFGEAELLYDIPSMLPKTEYLTCVNLGDGMGGSSVLLAKGIRDRGLKGTVFAVDIYKEHNKHKDFNRITYVNNGVGDYIVQHRGLTSVIGKKFKDEGTVLFDFVFIDASHRYYSVCADIKLWVPMVKSSGLVAIHDTNQDDVDKAIKDTLPPEWECFLWVNRTKVFKRAVL